MALAEDSYRFLVPFLGKNFVEVVDAYSKWAEVVEMTSTTAVQLRHLFATHGIPEQIGSDNGPQFVSADFKEFARTNGIRHIQSSPYHLALNGEAERRSRKL